MDVLLENSHELKEFIDEKIFLKISVAKLNFLLTLIKSKNFKAENSLFIEIDKKSYYDIPVSLN